RIWATAYAIPAAQGRSWGAILQSFEKPAQEAGLQKEVELRAEILLSIQAEVQRIELAVEELKPQVALLYNQYLARVQVEQRVASTGQEAELQSSAITEERSSVSTPTSAQAASVENAFPASGGLGIKQVVLLVIAGFAIFFLMGGTNLVTPLLRKLVMKV
ncbi:MAG: hypothetical protein HYW97_01875, partial [Candidatus Wildermuthbacteria bacterium]|nr:hypothetical protein [Candidatus Wildermuthbacteria bacterium]